MLISLRTHALKILLRELTIRIETKALRQKKSKKKKRVRGWGFEFKKGYGTKETLGVIRIY